MTATFGREELEAKIAREGDIVLVETPDPEYYEDAHLPDASTCHSIGNWHPRSCLTKMPR